jgi:translocation and assembly module TamB
MTVQLSGDLLLTQKEGEPSVVGELRAVQGDYRFMGRRFELDRGVVAFYGDLDSDPQLDLELRADIEGSVYRIAMQGWALAPELRLTSEPEQTEGDIIASLLFGKPLDELDTGQENLLKARTAQILTSLGSTRLMDRMSRSLGADLISYNQSAGADAASSLLVGKYLSPKLLLKYEQFLDRSNAYTVRLDYALSRFFRVETTVGQGAESGLELKWARDY